MSASCLCASGTSNERIYRLVFISAARTVGLFQLCATYKGTSFDFSPSLATSLAAIKK